jgi:hypothetical protein
MNPMIWMILSSEMIGSLKLTFLVMRMILMTILAEKELLEEKRDTNLQRILVLIMELVTMLGEILKSFLGMGWIIHMLYI